MFSSKNSISVSFCKWNHRLVVCTLLFGYEKKPVLKLGVLESIIITRDNYLRESRLILKIPYLNVILCFRGTIVLLQQDSCQSDRRLYKIYGPSRIGLIKRSKFSIYIILILLKKQKFLYRWCISAARIWISHIFWEEKFQRNLYECTKR